jgi:hypothetical protein
VVNTQLGKQAKFQMISNSILRLIREFSSVNLKLLGFKFKWQLGVIRAPHDKFRSIKFGSNRFSEF